MIHQIYNSLRSSFIESSQNVPLSLDQRYLNAGLQVREEVLHILVHKVGYFGGELDSSGTAAN